MVWIYHILLILIYIDRHMTFSFLAIRCQIIGSYGNCMFNILRYCQTIFQITALRYVSINNTWGFQFFQSFANNCYSIFFYYNHLSGCDMSSMDMKLGKLWEMGRDREAWHAAVQGVMKNWTQLGKWTTIVGGKSVRFGVICHTAMLTRTSVWWGKPLNWKSEDMSSSTI